MLEWAFLYFTLCLLPLVLSLDNTEEILALSSQFPDLQVFIHIDKIGLTLLQTKCFQLAQPILLRQMLQSLSQWSGLLLFVFHRFPHFIELHF